MALELGIKLEGKRQGSKETTQTPEEIAAQEAEREKMLQESMQAEVIGTVMKKLE